MNTPTAALDATQVWAWLGDVPDPEIPVISVVDLGIVRAVDVVSSEECIVTITPTYSGCPAMQAIADDIRAALDGVDVKIETALSPAWTTDWMTTAGKSKLRAAGIAPPTHRADAVPVILSVRCPQCGSTRTSEISRFGSTSCKALWRCDDCLEPFDSFKVL